MKEGSTIITAGEGIAEFSQHARKPKIRMPPASRRLGCPSYSSIFLTVWRGNDPKIGCILNTERLSSIRSATETRHNDWMRRAVICTYVNLGDGLTDKHYPDSDDSFGQDAQEGYSRVGAPPGTYDVLPVTAGCFPQMTSSFELRRVDAKVRAYDCPAKLDESVAADGARALRARHKAPAEQHTFNLIGAGSDWDESNRKLARVAIASPERTPSGLGRTDVGVRGAAGTRALHEVKVKDAVEGGV
ncbi:hypothetical protein BV25DRAFT_1843471 [Artomyces pyxidatus]|uniref:Uncharacterized protein n=1 Tax=Artomyces pyxidatus TaxID=48021 RepID=A0ACB8SEE7_9AGAM|nr:hypothetical protein BV25DRAFT_1843471 [Artomyces pyxidatus]